MRSHELYINRYLKITSQLYTQMWCVVTTRLLNQKKQQQQQKNI